MGDSQISGTWTHLVRQLHINCLELKVVLALRHWVSVLWGHQVLIATDNTTVVSYINKQGGTHSLVMSSSGSLYVAAGSGHSSQSQAHPRLFERDNGPPIQTQSADSDRVESKFRDCQSDFLILGNSTIPAYFSSCLRFWSLKHWMLCLRSGRGDQCTCFHRFLCSTRSFRSYVPPRQQK